MKVKANVKQSSPDEIITDFFKSHDVSEYFNDGDYSNLTAEGKACFALGIHVWQAFNKVHKK